MTQEEFDSLEIGSVIGRPGIWSTFVVGRQDNIVFVLGSANQKNRVILVEVTYDLLLPDVKLIKV